MNAKLEEVIKKRDGNVIQRSPEERCREIETVLKETAAGCAMEHKRVKEEKDALSNQLHDLIDERKAAEAASNRAEVNKSK